MVIAFPWAGRDWNRAIAISGRAAMPGLPGGSGFNWPSVAGTTGMLRPRAALSGLGRLARRRRGLGADFTGDIPSFTDFTSGSGGSYAASGMSIDSSGALIDTTTPLPSLTSTNLGPSASAVTAASQNPSSSSPWTGLLSSLVSVGGQITNYELNPLTNKSTYVQTPQGGIIATNQPTGATGIPGLTTSNLSSMMPLLLIGGGLMLFMMMAKR